MLLCGKFAVPASDSCAILLVGGVLSSGELRYLALWLRIVVGRVVIFCLPGVVVGWCFYEWLDVREGWLRMKCLGKNGGRE